MPQDVPWHAVLRRQTCAVDGAVLDPWIDVHEVPTDALHRPLEELGALPEPLWIQYLVDPGAEKKGQRLLTETEQTQLRGSVAGLNWAARQGRPDAAAAASVVAVGVSNAHRDGREGSQRYHREVEGAGGGHTYLGNS